MSVAEKYASFKPLPSDIRQRLQSLTDIFARHPVRLAYIFGSLAHGVDHAQDVDLAVLPEGAFSWTALYAEVSLLLGSDRLDLVDLGAVSPLLQNQVVQTGQCLYARSEEARLAFEQAVRQRFRDHLARLRLQEVYLRRRLGL